eukprot:c30695_g1_i1.p1 GENE.c30695_g1_i1~~c30695_g1_i1.p1  ORF type:complete len:115 (-),score=43.16 c30695_g1_i1:30-374(-)
MSKLFFLVLFAIVLAALAEVQNTVVEEPKAASTNVTSIPIPPTRAAPMIGKGHLARDCINQCGGLCRQICYKFKALSVCNGCVRGCLNKCDNGEISPVEYDPFHHPKPQLLTPQ